MNDTDRFPLFLFTNKEIIPLEERIYIFNYQYHHFVEKKKLKKQPELIEYQKLIYMPADMNYDIDRRTAGFKKRWGIDLKEVVYLDV